MNFSKISIKFIATLTFDQVPSSSVHGEGCVCVCVGGGGGGKGWTEPRLITRLVGVELAQTGRPGSKPIDLARILA